MPGGACAPPGFDVAGVVVAGGLAPVVGAAAPPVPRRPRPAPEEPVAPVDFGGT